MTILNRESEGLPSILLTISSILVREKAISRDELLRICLPNSISDSDNDKSSRFRGILNRWTTLGVFEVDDEKVKLAVELKRGESPFEFLARLPTICRRLPLDSTFGNPLWPNDGRLSEEGTGLTADYCRGLSWCLSQDIYTLPTSWAELENLIKEQMKPPRFVFLNNTRWEGLRDWARFFGFASGDDGNIFFDPTQAIRSELSELIKPGENLVASDFIHRIANRLPVLDGGSFRLEIEDALRPETWAAPPVGYLSTSLSFALRRLQKLGVLGLTTLADAESKFTLMRQGGHAWESFTHVSLLREEK
jgi:hypothetical protein